MRRSQSFADLLKAHRRRALLTQLGLALESGCDPAYISRLECQNRPPPSKKIMPALVAALGLSPTEAAHFYVAAGYLPPGVVTYLDDTIVIRL